MSRLSIAALVLLHQNGEENYRAEEVAHTNDDSGDMIMTHRVGVSHTEVYASARLVAMISRARRRTRGS
jgi:hypothetical protein